MTKNIIPELLAPAGSMEHIYTALTYGADAVYLGGPELNLRAQNQGFQLDRLSEIIQLVHLYGKKVYFCLNSFPDQDQLPQARDYLSSLKHQPPDGLIVADPGLIHLAQDIVPSIPLHLSTQANTTNSCSIRFWQGHNIHRINLARELNCRKIRKIREEVPDIELELFVHGAMCMSLSGHCLLSAYLNQRSANQGLCAHPCRYQYRVHSLLLEEKKRPGHILWEVLEESDYSSLLASDDLCLIKYLLWFVRNRINALKIEGRMKSNSYLAPILDAYKTALQDITVNDFQPKRYLQEIEKNLTRRLSTGFFLPKKRATVLTSPWQVVKCPVIAKIIAQEGPSTWLVSIRHKWLAESGFQIMVPGLLRPEIYPQEYILENHAGSRQTVVHPGQTARLRCDHPFLQPNLFLRRRPHNKSPQKNAF